MTSDKPTTSMQERMADLKETLKKEKVKLTPEVEGYIQEHVRAVQDKLQNGEDVYEEDLAFIGQVKLWVGMPEEWRKKYVSIEEMQEGEEMENVTMRDISEANKRHISFKQWLDVLHVAKAADKSRDWIDETFTFPGGGKIVAKEHLTLDGYTELIRLPKGLRVNWDLDLVGCTGITSLPDDLEVMGRLDLMGCKNLSSLPRGLRVGWTLDITHCASLTSLPDDLEVVGDVFFSPKLNEQVDKDIERLTEEGKIKWQASEDL